MNKKKIKPVEVVSFLLLVLSFTAQAQEKEGKKGWPDIPGAFLVEFGFARPLNASPDFSVGFWGSRSVNVYYQYPLSIPSLSRKFAFAPGIGLGMDRFKFKNDYVLDWGDGNVLEISKSELAVKKSMLVTNYLDVPLEIQYTANPDNSVRSFRAGGGFRAGWRISSFTKVAYSDGGETVKEKTKRDWNLNRFRYGVYAKAGVGNFSVFGYYNLSPFFNKGQAPGNDINTFTMGLSLGF